MRRIFKGQPPASLVTYKNKIGASFDSMDADVKEDLKESLLNEQGWICGYCQSVIRLHSQMKIEHFCEQSICDGKGGKEDLTLDYGNLMAVCLGKSDGILHCDSNKATFGLGKGLPMAVSPWIQAHMDAVRYRPSGKIDSTIERHAWEMDTILRLNISHLKDLRQRKFTQFFKYSRHPKPGVAKEKMQRLLETDLVSAGNKFMNDVPGLAEYMLRKFC